MRNPTTVAPTNTPRNIPTYRPCPNAICEFANWNARNTPMNIAKRSNESQSNAGARATENDNDGEIISDIHLTKLLISFSLRTLRSSLWRRCLFVFVASNNVQLRRARHQDKSSALLNDAMASSHFRVRYNASPLFICSQACSLHCPANQAFLTTLCFFSKFILNICLSFYQKRYLEISQHIHSGFPPDMASLNDNFRQPQGDTGMRKFLLIVMMILYVPMAPLNAPRRSAVSLGRPDNR